METEYKENGRKGVIYAPTSETSFAADGRVVFKYNPETGILETNEDMFPQRDLNEMFSSLVMTREKDYLLEMEPFGKILLENIRNYRGLDRKEMYLKDPSLRNSDKNIVHHVSEEYKNRGLVERIRDSMKTA